MTFWPTPDDDLCRVLKARVGIVTTRGIAVWKHG